MEMSLNDVYDKKARKVTDYRTFEFWKNFPGTNPTVKIFPNTDVPTKNVKYEHKRQKYTNDQSSNSLIIIHLFRQQLIK